jgi:acetyl esterase/lipase
MRMALSMRLFTTGLRLVPGVSVSQMDLAAIERAQCSGFHADIPGARLVTGRLAAGVDVQNRTIKGPAGDLPVRVYRRERPPPGAPLVVNFHGGGWVLGNLDSSDWLCSAVAARVGATVLSVGYRLAPRHPYPAAREDCVSALRWAVASCTELGVDPRRIAVMGDSAGGNLAAVTALHARDDGDPVISCQVLLYPGTDLTLASPSIDELAHAPVLTRADIEAFRRLYLGEADPRDPYISPLLAEDLSDLPPTLIQTAEHDPLVDDGRRYATALRAAGVDVRYTEYLGVPHGYASFPGVARRVAGQAQAEVCQELNDHLRS